jgi:outer membrane protein OmpA-like peptidoglycan-associated protein
MGVVSRNVASQGLNPLGLSNLLSEQKDEIAAASPAGLSHVLDAAGPTLVPPAARSNVVAERQAYPQAQKDVNPQAEREEYAPAARYVTTERERTGGTGSWLPILLLIALGLILFSLLRGRNARRAAEIATQQSANVGHAIGNAAQGALSSLALPGGAHISVPTGSMNYNLATFLGSGEAAPKTFIFDHLNFQSATTDLTPESTSTLNSLASILKAYPNSRVQLAGYTDNTGDPGANRRLSLDRANAVKGMLVAQGVSADRMAAVGMGEDHPVAPNDTEEGRAKNRRLELTVTSK